MSIHIALSIHITGGSNESPQGYIFYRYSMKGFNPDPQGSNPLLGRKPEQVISETIKGIAEAATHLHGAVEITHEVMND
tara:strand:+ start:849 stop:1085 length:237 start_codon:yes stop_codon:yes gene_type:complete